MGLFKSKYEKAMDDCLKHVDVNMSNNYKDAAQENFREFEELFKKLCEEGVILGYKALVNWEKTSVEAVEALIEVKITPQRDKGFDRIAERIYQYEEVESCYLMSGGYDVTVIITGRTLREVALFVSEKLSTIDGVTSTATHFILKKYKQQDVIFERREEQKERLIFS